MDTKGDKKNQGENKLRWKGRGAQIAPLNRFEVRVSVEDLADFEDLRDDERLESQNVPTEFIHDDSKSILTQNQSPDVPFRYSINPYRGCEHGCAYCYARPTHETLGLNAGLDFESKILVKLKAPDLLRQTLRKKAWRAEPIAFSGVTDCYQPAERRFQLTRKCLDIAHEMRQPVSIVTKNMLILRDLDILQAMAQQSLVHVYISLTTLDPILGRKLEPRTSSPNHRLRAIHQLASAGVPVGVLHAPLIPGLTDVELPELLKASANAGATTAHYLLLRLPFNVRPLFLDWLERCVPEKKSKVEALIRDMRGGSLNSTAWGARFTGTGPYANQLATTFRVFAKRYGLDRPMPPLDTTQFSAEGRQSHHQPSLFGD